MMAESGCALVFVRLTLITRERQPTTARTTIKPNANHQFARMKLNPESSGPVDVRTDLDPILVPFPERGFSTIWISRYARDFRKSPISFLFDDPGAQHNAVAVVVQLQREDQDIPVPTLFLRGQMGQAVEAAVHVSLARVGHGADDVFPFAAQFRKFLKTVLAHEPRR